MSELLAGVAEVDITPPAGNRMAGHFYEVLSDGEHDPLKAKAIVLQQGEEKFAWAFCDVVSLSPHVTRPAREQFSAASELPVARTMIAATHSHTGPLFDDVRQDYFHQRMMEAQGEDPHETVDYSDFLREQLVAVLVEANDSLAPSALSAVSTYQYDLSFNRRYHMRDGSVRFNPRQMDPDIMQPAGPIDPEISHLMIRDGRTARAVGGLTVFAAHCDTIGGNEYSADYPFFIEQALRQELGSEYVSAFAAGTCGDINHINVRSDGPRKGVDISKRIGGTIAASILSGQGSHQTITDPSFAMRQRSLALPLQEVTAAEVAAAYTKLPLLEQGNAGFMEVVDAIRVLDIARRGTEWQVEVQAFRLDRDTVVVGLPGEIFADLGASIKEQSSFEQTIIATIANDRLSYVPTEQAFQEGSYEVTNSRSTRRRREASRNCHGAFRRAFASLTGSQALPGLI